MEASLYSPLLSNILSDLVNFVVGRWDDWDNLLKPREIKEQTEESRLQNVRWSEPGKDLIAVLDEVIVGVMVGICVHPEGAFANRVDSKT